MAEIFEIKDKRARRVEKPAHALEGKRCKMSNGVFCLILDQQARFIEPGAHRELFGSDEDRGASRITERDIAKFPPGPLLSADPPSVRTSDGKVWLVDGYTQRWILNGETFNHYGFNWDKIVDPGSVKLPEGPTIRIWLVAVECTERRK